MNCVSRVYNIYAWKNMFAILYKSQLLKCQTWRGIFHMNKRGKSNYLHRPIPIKCVANSIVVFVGLPCVKKTCDEQT